MVFGKFLGDRRLDAQKAKLAESRAKIAELETRMRGADDLYDEFSRVWGDGVPEDLPRRLGKARELADLLHQRVQMAKRELPNFDEAAALLKRDIPQLQQRWTAFVAILVARKELVGGGSAYPLPGNEACQQKLIAMAEERYAAMRKHIDELAEIRPGHARPWPASLDIAMLERHITDIRGALDIYIGRLADGTGELPESSTATLFEIISQLENGITHVEEQRTQLAMDLAMHYVRANTGLR